MRFRPWHIIALTLLLVLSCRGPRKIPREEMVMIYHDIFLQDQYIKQDPSLRRVIDTTLVYEGVFRSYGYNTDDYLYSLSFYIKDPEKMAKIMADVSDILGGEAKNVRRQLAFNEWKEKLMSIYYSEIDTLGPAVPPPPVDSLAVRLVGVDVKFFPKDSL